MLLARALIRLGVPMVAFLGFVEPAVDYVVAVVNGSFHGSFASYYGKFIFFGYGILWFILALLFFAFAYAGLRRFNPRPTKPRPFPKNSAIIAFALLIGAASFAVRARALLFIPTLLTGQMASIWGGLHWQAVAYAFWEQLFGIAVMISLTVWFRENVNFQNRLMKALSDSSFTAYIIQVPVLVLLALGFQSIQLPLLAKFAVVSPIGVALCFLVAYLVRKIPKANRVL